MGLIRKILKSQRNRLQISFKITIDDPKLWYPDSPHLYDLFISIKDKMENLDALKNELASDQSK